jgi:hypothetical protein
MDKMESSEDRERLGWPARRVPKPLFHLVAALLLLGILAYILLPWLARARRGPICKSSASNLIQMGLIFKMYAHENDGRFPPLAPYKGVWMIDLERVYPEYLTDPRILVNPSLPDAEELEDRISSLADDSPVNREQITRIAARSYAYTNWLVRTDAEAEELRKGYMELAEGDYDRNLQVGDRKFRRLREGVEKFLKTNVYDPRASTQAQSEIPVMFETVGEGPSGPFYREPPGSNVLYMSGRVEFIRYGEQFPATEAAADAFRPPSP